MSSELAGNSGPAAECFRFLRRIEEHRAALASGIQPAHASRCARCSERLQGVARVADLLRARPSIESILPPAVARELSVDRIAESIVRASQQSELAPVLRELAAPLCAAEPALEATRGSVGPHELVAQERVVHELRRKEAPPAWLWRRAQAQVQLELERLGRSRAGRWRWGVRLSVVSAAASVCLAFLGWSLRGSNPAKGTQEQPEIVFVSISELPWIEHPTTVLRSGLNR